MAENASQNQASQGNSPGSSSGSSPSLFPAAGASPEPNDAAATTLVPPTNLSPPPSQDRPADATAANEGDAMNVDPPESSSQGQANATAGGPSGRRGRTTVPSMAVPAEGEPGHSWMNERAQEDMRRSREAVLDRNFTCREFGDLYDERT